MKKNEPDKFYIALPVLIPHEDVGYVQRLINNIVLTLDYLKTNYENIELRLFVLVDFAPSYELITDREYEELIQSILNSLSAHDPGAVLVQQGQGSYGGTIADFLYTANLDYAHVLILDATDDILRNRVIHKFVKTMFEGQSVLLFSRFIMSEDSDDQSSLVRSLGRRLITKLYNSVSREPTDISDASLAFRGYSRDIIFNSMWIRDYLRYYNSPFEAQIILLHGGLKNVIFRDAKVLRLITYGFSYEEGKSTLTLRSIWKVLKLLWKLKIGEIKGRY